ncbi:hypothetical protein F5B22DRAFT_639716 [Xylaria bambusicola]|uniref:uncharacterized protein n=1 Tax=Xylaria bambusicola TaxID=326684 RepID=UPI00200868E4|nr:uncharacterized protein F5B22DRAFT_639716 [Xylaria bambusicola]KAI0505761.1 hypothetical protein F5B22DRAFT_639716 [Xylaria bambusicola]
MPIAIFADVAVLGILGGAAGGTIGSWCSAHPKNKGCVGKKRDILGTEAVPKMRIERQDVGPCNVAQFNFDRCHEQLATVTVTSSLPAAGEVKFDGVPPACMDLAGVLTGSCPGGNGPMITVCGSDCLHYTGLTDDQLGALSKALSTS